MTSHRNISRHPPAATTTATHVPAGFARAAAALLVIASVAGGCAKQEAEPTQALPTPIDPAQAQRGQQACQSYAEQVCACAKTRVRRIAPNQGAQQRPAAASAPDLQEACHLAPAKLSSLEMVISVNRTTESADERHKTGRTAQKIIKSCIEEQAALVSKGCRPHSR